LLTLLLTTAPAKAEDPPKKLSAEERKNLEGNWEELTAAGIKAYQARNYSEAIKSFEAALALARQLYPKNEFQDGHEDLISSLGNLAELYRVLGKPADAEPLCKDALAMSKRQFKGDHPAVAINLGNLAVLHLTQGKLADAEPLCKDALAMHKRLLKGDHPAVAASLNNRSRSICAQRVAS